MVRVRPSKLALFALVFGLALGALALGVSIFRTLTAEYEEPEYRVLSEHDEYEVRLYQPYLVAETRVSGDFREAGGAAFRRLAGYIFGDNQRKESMRMTSPVESERGDGVVMDKTVPVESEEQPGQGYIYRFVMEKRFARSDLPKPNDPRITLRQVPERRIAARTFSGRWTKENYASNENALRNALARDGLLAAGNPRFSAFNDPFTVPFLRRNEVHLDLVN